LFFFLIYAVGMAYSKIGLQEQAISDFTRVLANNPDHVNALFARAACYNTIGQFSAAIEDYNIALLKDQSQSGNRDRSPEKSRRSLGSFSNRSPNYPSSAVEPPVDLRGNQGSPSDRLEEQVPRSARSDEKTLGTSVSSLPAHPIHFTYARSS
jgi:tetratricopeptide (TPR) repeat protein